jgi:hypothetical protein
LKIFLDSGFRRRDENRKGIVLFVIPAQAGIQEDEKMKSSLDNYGLISNSVLSTNPTSRIRVV